MTVDGSRFLTNAGLLLVQLGLVATSLFIWFFSALTFFGDPLGRSSYAQMALGFGLGAALLLLLLVPARALGAATWVGVIAIVLASLCTLAALLAAAQAIGTPTLEDSGESWWWAIEMVALSPAAWVTVVLVALAPRLRGRSRPTPRSPQAR